MLGHVDKAGKRLFHDAMFTYAYQFARNCNGVLLRLIEISQLFSLEIVDCLVLGEVKKIMRHWGRLPFAEKDCLQSYNGIRDECFTGLSKAYEQNAHIAAATKHATFDVIGRELEACGQRPL